MSLIEENKAVVLRFIEGQPEAFSELHLDGPVNSLSIPP